MKIIAAIEYIFHLVFLMFIGMVIEHLLGHLSVFEKSKKSGDQRNVGEVSPRITVGFKMGFLAVWTHVLIFVGSNKTAA